MKQIYNEKVKHNKITIGFLVVIMFLIPLLLSGISTAISSIAAINYIYMPRWLDFSVTFFYNASTFILGASMFFSLGIAGWCIISSKTSNAVTAGIACFLSVSILPLLQYVIRHLFMVSSISAVSLYQYFQSDLYTALSNAMEAAVALIIAIAVGIFYKKKKYDIKFSRPYILPRGAAQLSAIIFFAAMAILSVILFIADGSFTSDDFISLGFQIAVDIAGYILFILGAIFVSNRAETSRINK